MSNEQRLEDFGEHIAGAKKETYFRAIDPTSEETKSLPLSKLWADKDIKAIKDIEIASIAHTLRDALPNRPRSPYKLNRWLDEVSKNQKVVVDLMEKNDPVFTEIVMKELEKTHSGSKAYLLTKLDREDWKKVGDVRFYQNTNQNNAIYLSVQLKGDRHSFHSKESATIKNYNARSIIDEFAGDIQTILKDKDKNMATKEMTASSFDIYTYKKDNTAFICAKTDRQKTPLITFETLAEAREYKKDPENIAELGRRWTAHREQNSITKSDMRNAVNEERTGQSYRDHDITPDEFMATFGVRGGQFGNWVTGDERQQMLNNAYDGFMDLSKALKIEQKAIGLNGTLGIAFGARGSGNASAHYERGEQVINLTKTRGAGSLAHEWWHALDHYMKNGDDLLTRHLNANSTARHQELIAPVRELVKGIHKSEFYSRSQTADAYRSPAYFSTDVEMTARAFEGHIQHTLSKMGIKNDFLVNIRAEKDWQKNLDAYPYPKAEELEPLGKAYNAVFDTLKEVDKEFVPTHYEPEQIIHADTLAVNDVDKTKEGQTKQSLNTANEPQAQTVGEATPTQEPQELPSAVNKILINNYLENNGFEKGINVGSYRKQIDDNNLLVVGVANDVSIQSVADNQVKEQETILSSLAQNLNEDDIKQAFNQSKLWQTHLVQSVQPTIQAEQPVQPTPVDERQQATAPTPNISQYNTKLNTPYAEKNEAKALGAKWDNTNKTWYVPAGLDLSKFEKWLVPEKEKTTENPAITQTPQGKTYLYTTPSDNEAIQKLKADGIVKFDLPNKVWYTLEPENPQVKQWLQPAYVPSAEEAFAEHLRANGISLDNGHPIADGRPHRLSNDGSNDKNVMYQLYRNDGGIPAGRITNFSRGGTPEKWVYPAEYIAVLKNIEAVNVAKGLAKPTPNIAHSSTEKTYPTQEQGQSPKTHSVSPEQQATYDKTASRVAMVMQFAPLAQQHEYLDRKQVTHNHIMRIVPDKSQLPPQFANDIVIANDWKEAQALRNQGDERMILQKGNLMIPQFNEQGELRSFETIGYQGAKYALKGGEKNGLSVTLGQAKNGEPIIIAEGYATGATLHEQTGRTVVVAFGKGGLLNVAQQLREHYPDSKIYIGADNDHAKTLEINPNTGKPHENVGLVDAQKVAEAVPNTHVLAPQFNTGDKGKDWNDVYVNQGVDEFKRQLKEQLNRINPPKEQPNITQSEPTVQERLDSDFIKQSYPQMSDENLKAIQVWKEVITHSEKYAPETKEDLLKRLADHIPSYANGERLPLPTGYVEQQNDMGKQIPIEHQHQGYEKDDGGRQ